MTDPWIILVGIVAVLFILMVAGRISAARQEKARREKLRKAYGGLPGKKYSPEEVARIPRYFEKHRDDADFAVDDITAGDLDIYTLFARINYCRSAAGEEVLYHVLRTPQFDPAHQKDLEEEIKTFSDDNELRLDVQMTFDALGGSGKYSVYDYLSQLSTVEKRGNAVHYAGAAALLLGVALLFVKFSYGFPLLLVVAIYQILSYYRMKGESDAYLSTFAYILRLITCADRITKRFEKPDHAEACGSIGRKLAQIRECTDRLRKFSRGANALLSSARMSGTGDPASIIADYIRMLLHIDLIKFNQMVREAGEHEAEIDRLIGTLGSLEASISIACYRASIPLTGDGKRDWCIPEFTSCHADGPEQRPELEVSDLTHALIEEGAVPNSMSVKRSVLLTGSNASGKSTWLKSLGLAALMAQTINTVTASSYRAPHFRIYSSMALTDNLSGGESYYIVEIRALSRVLDAAKDEDAPPVLCFIDEVLRGTNTIERIAASAQILEHFTHANVLLFAATHDLELTGLLADCYDNYHFEGILDEEDVRFDYILKEGPSVTRNAIGLLRRFSYDRDITERAEVMAQRFEETGIWSMSGEGGSV